MKRTIRSVAMLISSIFLAAGCDFKAASPAGAPRSDEPQQVTVNVTKVMAGDLKLNPILSMKVFGYETTQLNSKIDGYVQRIAVDIGDRFKQGDELAVFHAPELGDEVIRREKLLIQITEVGKSAQANIRTMMARRDEQSVLLKLRKIKQRMTAELVHKGSLNQEKLDEADAAVEVTIASIRSAQANVDAAEADYNSAVAQQGVAAADLKKARSLASYRSILAPFDGVVIERHLDSGAMVNSTGTPLLTVAIQKRVKVIVYLSIDQAAQLDIGDPVVLHDLASMPDVTIDEIDGKPLTISRFSSAVDQQSHMRRAEIYVDNVKLMQQRNFALTIGDYGKVSIVLHDYRGKPTVLASAVGSNSQGDYVSVVDNNIAKEVPVRSLLTKEVKQGSKTVNYTVLGNIEGSVQTGDLVVIDDLNSVPIGETLVVEKTQ